MQRSRLQLASLLPLYGEKQRTPAADLVVFLPDAPFVNLGTLRCVVP